MHETIFKLLNRLRFLLLFGHCEYKMKYLTSIDEARYYVCIQAIQVYFKATIQVFYSLSSVRTITRPFIVEQQIFASSDSSSIDLQRIE